MNRVESSSSSRMRVYVALLVALAGGACAVEIDNGVIGVPEVMCREDGIRLLVNVRQPFAGHVYVKSQFRMAGCHASYASNALHPKELVFDVPYRGGCLVRRERSLNPNGVVYHATVVVQFHDLFVTKVDKAFALSCLYSEHGKQLQQQIDVSVLPTTELVAEQRMPTCSYQILLEDVNGTPVRFARVGDKLFHKWECVPPETHGMLVHSCAAKDGLGNEHRLIDERGCSLDPIGLGELTYSQDLMTAWVQTHAFKFADRLQINFQCHVTVCIKVDGGCQGITPPRCSGLPVSGGSRPGAVGSRDLAIGGASNDDGNVQTRDNADGTEDEELVDAAALQSNSNNVPTAPSLVPSPPSLTQPGSQQQQQQQATPPLPEPRPPTTEPLNGAQRGFSHRPRMLDNTGLVPYAVRHRRSLPDLQLASDDIILFGAGDDYDGLADGRSCAASAGGPTTLRVYQVLLALTVAACLLLLVVTVLQRRQYCRLDITGKGLPTA